MTTTTTTTSPETTPTANPVRALRERCGMNRGEFARHTGCSYQTLAQAEAGWTKRLPRPVREALMRLGEDVARVEREYIEWRDSFRA